MTRRAVVLSVLVFCLLAFTPAYGYFITSQSDPSLVCATVVTFEAVQGFYVGEYSGAGTAGVFMAWALDNHLRIDDYWSGSYNTTGQYLENGPDNNPGFSSLQINFDVPAKAFGFHWGASDVTWTLTAYDAGNNVIETYNLPITHSSNAGEFYGIAASNMA